MCVRACPSSARSWCRGEVGELLDRLPALVPARRADSKPETATTVRGWNAL